MECSPLLSFFLPLCPPVPLRRPVSAVGVVEGAGGCGGPRLFVKLRLKKLPLPPQKKFSPSPRKKNNISPKKKKRECNQKHLPLFQHKNLQKHAAKQCASLSRELNISLESYFERNGQNFGPSACHRAGGIIVHCNLKEPRGGSEPWSARGLVVSRAESSGTYSG